MWRKGGQAVVYLYYVDMPGTYGEDLLLDRATFLPGKWHQLTQHIRVNAPCQSNGVLDVWFDGKKVLSRSDIRFRVGEKGLIDSLYFSTFNGGSTMEWAPGVDSFAFFDDFTISRERSAYLDAPEDAHDSTVLIKTADSYEHALQNWKTPEDISAWIAANFSYDMARAVQLSETQRANNNQLSIYHPAELFNTRSGVFVDLSRFGVEAMRRIDPQSNPKYLMIEFDPIYITGNTLRFHWLVAFRRDHKTYFFADSNRPGHIAGPYNETRDFIEDYERYRGRKIVAFREVESYQRQKRTRALKRQASEKP